MKTKSDDVLENVMQCLQRVGPQKLLDLCPAIGMDKPHLSLCWVTQVDFSLDRM